MRQITMKVPEDKGDMQPPALVHYEVSNFYQNYVYTSIRMIKVNYLA